MAEKDVARVQQNNYFTEICSGSEAGSYLRPINFVYHSTLGVRVIKKKQLGRRTCQTGMAQGEASQRSRC